MPSDDEEEVLGDIIVSEHSPAFQSFEAVLSDSEAPFINELPFFCTCFFRREQRGLPGSNRRRGSTAWYYGERHHSDSSVLVHTSAHC